MYRALEFDLGSFCAKNRSRKMVLPTSVFQHEGHQKSLMTNGSMSKCSSMKSVVDDTSNNNVSPKAEKKATLVRKPTQSILNSASCQISSNGSSQVSILHDDSIMISSDGLISNMLNGEKHVKKHVKKKKNKKKKLGKRSFSNVSSVAVVEMADQTCLVAENTNGTTEMLPLFEGETGNFVNGINADFNRTAQTISVSEKIKPSSGSVDAPCTSIRSKECAETFVSKGSVMSSLNLGFSWNTSDSEKLEKCSSTRSETKQPRMFPAPAFTSKVCDSEPSHKSSKSARNCGYKLSNSSSSLTESCVSTSHSPLSYNDNQKIDIYQSGSQENLSEASRLYFNEGKVIFDCDHCKFEVAPESFCFGSMSETIFVRSNSGTCSSSNENIWKEENKADRDGRMVRNKFKKTSCGISEVVAAIVNKSAKQDQRHSSNGMLHMHGFLNHLKQGGKENSNLTYRRVHKKMWQIKTSNGKEFIHGDSCKSAGLQEAAMLEESYSSSRPISFAETFRDFVPLMYLKNRSYVHALEESSWWVPWQKSLAKVGQKALGQYYHTKKKERIQKLNQLSRWDRCVQCSRSNLHMPQTREVFFQKRVLEVTGVEQQFKSSYDGEVTQANQCSKHNLSEMHNLRILDSAASNRPLLQMASNISDGKIEISACFKSNLLHDKIIKQDSLYRKNSLKQNSLKQISVGFLDVTAVNFMKGEATEESQGGASHEAPNLLGIRRDKECSNRLGSDGGICLREKNINATSGFRINDNSVCISSQMAFQILNASYMLRMASECVNLATGSPIAEFEKLLYVASPIVSFPSVHRHYDACICKQCIPNVVGKQPNIIGRHHIIDVLLVDVWSWYEEHGNYGLELKVEPSWNTKKARSDEASFQAYFVPSLSAVQLFCYSQHPIHATNQRNDADVAKKSQDGICLLYSLPEIFYPTHSKVGEMCFDSFDGNSLPLTPSLESFDESELLFEYFEHERPEQRKPLCAKIKELVEVGTSNHQIYGDPSKLECMKLQDLHPASWYSVAWYPIYRIPEGTFRASFLTYHSLGYLLKRRIKADSVESGFCLVSPVLGMESYNAQGECWFKLREAVEIFSQNGVLFNSSDVLKERLRTLEAAAASFSRGSVYKSHVNVRNKHPDYEFFFLGNSRYQGSSLGFYEGSSQQLFTNKDILRIPNYVLGGGGGGRGGANACFR